MKKAQIRHLVHNFEPIKNQDSKILILGSVPSVKSVEKGFYYMNPSNRFWRIMERLTRLQYIGLSKEEKTKNLLASHIAIYDAIYECEILGSSDNNVNVIKATDLKELIKDTQIKRIFCNGKLSYNMAVKYNPDLADMIVFLPSTSPANAVKSLDELTMEWQNKIGVFL